MHSTSDSSFPGVLLVPPLFLPESYGGAEQQTMRFGVELAAQGVDVGVLTIRQQSSTPAQEVRDGLRIKRIKVRAPAYLGGKYTLSWLKWCFYAGFYVLRRRRSLGVIHIVHGKLHAVPFIVLARWLGIKTVVKLGRSGEHFDLDRVRAKKIYGPGCAWVLTRWVNVFVANSREISTDLQRCGIEERRIVSIPNGVKMPPDYSDTCRRPNSLVYAGRLDPEKAVDVLLRCLASIEEREWHLDVYGDGECMDQLRALAIELGLGVRVVFHGAVADVSTRFRECEFYVSSSLSEGMSNSLLEAMSAGAIPLVTRVGGVSDLVSHGESGLLANATDQAQYARILTSALSLSREQRITMSASARQVIRDRFSMQTVVERHIQLYRRLIVN